VPFPQIKVTTVSSEGVMALIRQRDDLQFWVASGKQVLLMRDGLVVRTVGLGTDLDGTRWQGQSPFQQGCTACRTATAAAGRSTWWMAIASASPSPAA